MRLLIPDSKPAAAALRTADCQSAVSQVVNLPGVASKWRARRLPIGDTADCQSAVPPSATRRQAAGFTLAEVLAALMFLAIVIPTAVEALHVASLAGEVAARKSEAARVADRILNESVVTTNWSSGIQSGTVTEGILDFRWKLTTANWPQDSMQLLTAEVTYTAQGKDFTVRLSTLANSQTTVQPTGTGTVQAAVP